MQPTFFPPVPASPKGPDALALLADQHDALRRALERVDLAAAPPSHADLVDLCLALKINGVLERELVYPAARSARAHDPMLERAQTDHETVEQMIESLLALEPSDALLRDRVHALLRVVDRQFEEAEIALFTRLAVSELDLEGLGVRLAARRSEVLAELGLPGKH